MYTERKPAASQTVRKAATVLVDRYRDASASDPEHDDLTTPPSHSPYLLPALD